MPYLYLWETSALYNRAVVSRQPDSAPARATDMSAAPKPEVPQANGKAKNKIHAVMNPKEGPRIRVIESDSRETKPTKALEANPSSTPPSTTAQDPPTSSFAPAAPSPPSTPTLAQKQRAILLSNAPAPAPQTQDPGDSTADAQHPANPALQIRKIASHGPEHVLPLQSMQTPTHPREKAPAARGRGAQPRQLTIRKMEQVGIRKVDFGLQEAARKRAHTKTQRMRKEVKRDVLRADEASKKNADAE